MQETALWKLFSALFLLPSIEAVRFNQVPPSVQHVLTGKKATFEWDYYVRNRDNEFSSSSPQWSFYTSSGVKQVIALEDKFDSEEKWKWKISPTTCPARYLNPTRVSKKSKATMVISNVITADSGEYGCSLELATGGPIQSKVQLIVTVHPRFSPQQPLNKSIAEGQNLNLPCAAIGPPTPNITWVQIAGHVIMSTGTGSATLRIPNIRRDQNGTYECQARNNPSENPVTAKTVVTVYYKPVIDVAKSSLSYKSWNGNSVRLKCLATGLPKPSILWYKPTNQQITTGVDTLSGGSEVVVKTENQEDYGQYRCRATNFLGSEEHIINITSLFPPGPATITITEIEASSITVRWTKPANDGGRPVTAYLLEINSKTLATRNTYAVITHLKKETQYTLNLYAKNDIGYGVPSAKMITTKKSGKPAIPELSKTLLQAEGQKISVTLRWTKPDENGGKIVRYTIYIKNVTRQSNWTKNDDVNDLSQLVYTESKNIKYGKIYKFIVTAWNMYGESVRDENSARTVNITEEGTAYTSKHEVKYCAERASKSSSIVFGVIIAFLVISLAVNVLQFVWPRRKCNLSGRKAIKTQRKTAKKTAARKSFDSDLEMRGKTTSPDKASNTQQPLHVGPEYETIQQPRGMTNPAHEACTSSDLLHYQGLNLPSNTTVEVAQGPVYEPLNTRSVGPITQTCDKDYQYEPLDITKQKSDYQSLNTNNRESTI